MAGRNWSPGEVRKLIALFGGIGLAAAGVFLIANQVQAGGAIDISTGLFSGRIESGSAGLLLCFLGVCVIVFAAVASGEARDRIESRGNEALSDKARRLGFILDTDPYIARYATAVGIGWLIVIGLVILQKLVNPEPNGTGGFAATALFFGMVLFPATIGLAVEWIREAKNGKG